MRTCAAGAGRVSPTPVGVIGRVETAEIKTVRFIISGFIFFVGSTGSPVGLVYRHRRCCPSQAAQVCGRHVCTAKTRGTAVHTVVCLYVRGNASCLHDETTAMTIGYDDVAKNSGASAAMRRQPRP